MTVSTFFVSEAALRTLKQRAQRGVKGVSSSHLSEAVAAALGFKTHAAMRAALAGRATAEAQKPSNARLVQRLRQFGYAAPETPVIVETLVVEVTQILPGTGRGTATP